MDGYVACSYVVRDNTTGEEKVLHVSKEQAGSDTHLRDAKTGRELEVVDKASVCACVCFFGGWGGVGGFSPAFFWKEWTNQRTT